MMKYENYWVSHQQNLKTNRSSLCFIAIIYLFQTTLILPQNLSSLELDQNIAQDLVQLYIEDDIQQVEYLNSAIQNDPQNSDIYYLLADYEFDNENYYEAENFVLMSLELDNWYYQFRINAVYLHIQILYRQKRFQELYLRYTMNDSWRSYLENSNIFSLLIESVYRSGNNPSELLQEAISRYPSDLRFQLRRMLYEGFPYISDLANLSSIEFNSPEDRSTDFDDSESNIHNTEYTTLLSNTILYYLLVLSNADSSELFNIYSSFSLNDPLINYFQSRDSPISDFQSMITIEESNIIDYITLLTFFENNTEILNENNNILNDNLVLSIDLDRDKRAEAVLEYINLQLANIRIFLDSEITQTIFFQINAQVQPQRIEYSNLEQNINIELIYSNYPDLSRIRLERDNTITEYELENSTYQPLIFLRSENDYSINENLLHVLKGSAHISNILVYLSLPNSVNNGSYSRAGVIWNEINPIQEIVDSLVSNAYRQTIISADGIVEVRNFDNREISSAYFDYNGDSLIDAISVYEDNIVQYRLRKVNDEFIYSQYDSLGNNIESRAIMSNEMFQLPMSLQNYNDVFNTDVNN